jgi:CRISPR-associated protein Csx10
MIDVTVRARQRLHLGIRPDSGWVSDSYPFVPGSVLRGALAAAWIAEQPPSIAPGDDPDFQALFEGSIRFGPLFTDPRSLWPLSVFRCKYSPTPECAASVYDAAFSDDRPETCRCGSPLEQSKGKTDGETVERTQVQMVPEQDVALDGGLFSRRAIPAGTELRGHIVGDHPWLATEPVRLVRLGGRRSTSGLAEVTLSATAQVPGHGGLDADRNRLVLRLLSPAIFIDGWGRPRWRPDEERLAQVLGVPVELAAEWVRPVAVGGWHVVSNMPKSREFAVAAGSVYVLKLGAAPEADRLHELWRRGLGIRRSEGFGWVSLDRWQPPPPAATLRSGGTRTDADGEIITALLRHGLVHLVLAELRRRQAHGGTGVPRTRRFTDLTVEPRELVDTIFGFDPDRQRKIITRLDAISRRVLP